MNRLDRQILYIAEMDRLKAVLRRSRLISQHRTENTAEHCWHLTIAAMTLAEYADETVDLLRVLQILIVHDVVEIEALDAFAYDAAARANNVILERQAANRLFAMLPDEQGKEFRELWEEFEDRKTPEARFALVVDRLVPFIINFYSEGKTWKEYGITKAQVLHYNEPIQSYSSSLWNWLTRHVDEAVERGFLDA